MKKIFGTLLLFVALFVSSISVSADDKRESYSDDYVSFDYLPEANCNIFYFGSEGNIYYDCFTDMKKGSTDNAYSMIGVFNIKKYEEENGIESGAWKKHYFESFSDENYDISYLENGEYPELKAECKDESGIVLYVKLIGFSKNDFAVISCVLNSKESKESELCKMIYDTAKVSDKYFNEGYSLKEDYLHGTIYKNVILSDQCIKYATVAIETLEDYLSFEISSDDALSKIDDIRKRCENYSDDSEFTYDEDVASALKRISSYIENGNDDRISGAIYELKELADIE